MKGNSLKMKMSEFSLNGFEKNADRTVVPDEHSWIYSSLMKKKPFDALSADALNAIALSFFPIDVSPNSEVADTNVCASTAFLVETGIVYDKENGVKVLHTYKPGDVVGGHKIVCGNDTEKRPVGPDERQLFASPAQSCRLWALTRPAYQRTMIQFAKHNEKKFSKLVRQIPALAPLTQIQLTKVASQLRRLKFGRGERIVCQGDIGDAMYFIETGNVQVIQRSRGSSDKVVNTLAEGAYFGEAALYGDLSQSTRNADVVAASQVLYVWQLTRKDFELLLGPLHEIIRVNSVARVLQRVKEFVPLSNNEIELLASTLETRNYKNGEFIIRQGEVGDEMFIVETGEIAFLRSSDTPVREASVNLSMQTTLGEDEEKEEKQKLDKCTMKDIGHLFSNQYFGEGALLTCAPRRASAKVVSHSGATCFVLSGEKFRRLFGDELKHSLTSKFAKRAGAEDDKRGEMIALKDITGIKLLGRGSYGKVTLIRHIITGKTFALKQILKEKVESMDQFDHIDNEKDILASIHHPMVCNLIRTLKNERSLYMLMDAVMGGELFKLLQDKVKFSKTEAQFYGGQVVLVFDYLHSRNIAFRDLKPENIMVNHDGYIKVCDFGLAKMLDHKNSRTYTLCGTPAYAAPEVYAVLGHGVAVDWWTLGVLLHELLAGYTPFMGSDANQIYSELRRYEMYYPRVAFPRHFSKVSSELLKMLLNPRPQDRLGSSNAGAQDIMQHAFFKDLSFPDLMARTITPPHVPIINDIYDTSNFKERKEDFERDIKPAPKGYSHEPWCKRF